MPPELSIDVAWLLEQQAAFLPKALEVTGFSGLVAAVARHKVNAPKPEYLPDASRRAAALFHEIVSVRPLLARNPTFAALGAISSMQASGEGLAEPYGGFIDLAHAVRAGQADVFTCAEPIRHWRV
ncbi:MULTISPECIES: toxin Doc [Streptomyces]|uniref:toxin Doc n=1 Tax=Streptomyces TaxID=1883 RepID=UPI00163B8F90|nr:MULTISPECIES: toxin Doc [Streptomyces]MBC2876497.1 toxin Doc [Streptomyces sp. TYQ1024]UBI40830.1 toxin Doc [Streptomyces mobaraensis]